MNHDQLHEYVKDAIAEIRRRFNELHISEYRLDIECTGRVEGGEPRIAYKLSTGGYLVEGQATGARLGPVLDETARRYGWSKANDPLALPAPEELPAIPF